jgi:polysaccharide pyruvyl transferase WcaK-like protein
MTVSWAPVRIGLWGTFDVENYGDIVIALITMQELQRRLPAASIELFSPFGDEHPTHFGAVLPPVEALGRWRPERLDELAGRLDAVVIGGGEIIHTQYETFGSIYDTSVEELRARAPWQFFVGGLGPRWERERVVVWHSVGLPLDPDPAEARELANALADRAYVSIRDSASQRRLVQAGVTRPIELVADCAFLLPRFIGDSVVTACLAQLRAEGHYPDAGMDPIVVQGSRAMLPQATAIAEALRVVLDDLPRARLVGLEPGPCHGNDAFLAALGRELPLHHRVPADATLEHVTAAIAGSSAFVGVSLHGNIVARAYGRPHVIVNLWNQTKLDGLAELLEQPDLVVRVPVAIPSALHAAMARPSDPHAVDELRFRVDTYFDGLADAIVGSWDDPYERDEIEGLHRELFDARCERDRSRSDIATARRDCDELSYALDTTRAEAEAARAQDHEVRVALEAARAEAKAARAEAEAARRDGARTRTELDALTATKTFRWSSGIRRAWRAGRRVGERWRSPRILDLSTIRGATLHDEPYGWARVDSVIRPEQAPILMAEYPTFPFATYSMAGPTRSWHYEGRSLVAMGGSTPAFPATLHSAWRRLAVELVSPAYRAAMSRLAGIDLTAVPIEVNVFHYPPGGVLSPHNDLEDKIVTHVLYFNGEWDPADGGCLHILRSGDEANIAAVIPPVVGASAVIVRSEHSWHAVEPVRSDSALSRRSLTVTFYRPGAVSTMWPPGEEHALHAVDPLVGVPLVA